MQFQDVSQSSTPSLFSAHRGLIRLVPAICLLTLCGGNSYGQLSPSAGSASTISAEYGKLPLKFEANQGQSDPEVKFSSRGSGYSLFLTDSAAVLALSKENRQARSGTKSTGARTVKTDTVRMELAGASRDIRIAGADQLPGRLTTCWATILRNGISISQLMPRLDTPAFIRA